jgi:phosphoribosylformylglycinamidine cyclo-ligase
MWSYAKAGVDLNERDVALRGLIGEVSKTLKNRNVLLDIGHYANLVDAGDKALVLCTDGVGTKVMVARRMNRYDTIGIDCIAMNVNDAICVGAEPIAMVDYITIDKPDPEILKGIGKGLRKGADESGISIIGGETAITPELVNGFDLAGTCVGVVEKDRVIDGSDIKQGDTLIGLRSNGIHSNGFTLARKVLDIDERTGKELLRPTRIYVKPILELISKIRVKGLAHITGGGLLNLKRLNKGMGFEIDDWPRVPWIFGAIEKGGVERAEMFRTFNMGIGFCVITSPEDAEEALYLLKDYDPRIIGRTVKDKKRAIRLNEEALLL